MPVIKPISDLRNHFNDISELCHEGAEPIFITKNGVGDLVVMSMALYERERAKLTIYQKLFEAELESKETKKRYSHKDVFENAEAIIDQRMK